MKLNLVVYFEDCGKFGAFATDTISEDLLTLKDRYPYALAINAFPTAKAAKECAKRLNDDWTARGVCFY